LIFNKNIKYNKNVTEEENKTYKSKRNRKILPGIILVLLGSIILLNNYGFTDIDIARLWPIFLIIPGVFMLLGASKKH